MSVAHWATLGTNISASLLRDNLYRRAVPIFFREVEAETAMGGLLPATVERQGDVAMTRLSGARPVREHAKVLGASIVGTVVEYYDFYIYGVAAAIYFGVDRRAKRTPLWG